MKGFTWDRKIDIKIPLDRLHASEVIAPKENLELQCTLSFFIYRAAIKEALQLPYIFCWNTRCFLGFARLMPVVTR